jgi:uncharacterized protein with FMN-binding domain
VTVVVLLFGYHTSTSGALVAAHETVTPSPAQPGAPVGAGAQAPTSSNTGGTSRGPRTFTGPVAQTAWGPVQVQISTDGATITHVSVLQYPQGSSTDDQINGYALPILVQETLNAQSANIDMVSGATVTSGGYLQSLQAAVDEARL